MNSKRRLIVYESRPYWQPELQRRFLSESVDVIGCRSIPDLHHHTTAGRVDAVILDLAADNGACLRWLVEHDGVGPSPPVVTVADDERASWEWRVRELGATVFVHELVGGMRMAEICRKLWRNDITHGKAT